MFGIPGEFLLAFVMLGMGGIAFYAGSLPQEKWNDLVFYDYDRQPWRKELAKFMGLAFLLAGMCMAIGLLTVGPEFLSFLKL